MDGPQFDRLTQRLSGAFSRRRFGALLTVLGVGAGLRAPNAEAAKKKKKKKKKKRTGGTGTPTSTTTLPPGPSCTDGIKNGKETDIDCGGPDCSPCASGRTCTRVLDCTSGHCSAGICRICSEERHCASDINGSCLCDPGSGTCISQRSIEVGNCNACPEGWVCRPGFDLTFFCSPVCASSDSCGTGDFCKGEFQGCGQAGGVCFQPLGGGPSRCSTSISSTCGCTSDQDCSSRFGASAFCATFSGNICTCGASTTFCARARPR